MNITIFDLQTRLRLAGRSCAEAGRHLSKHCDDYSSQLIRQIHKNTSRGFIHYYSGQDNGESKNRDDDVIL